jgi:hypothetical protein
MLRWEGGKVSNGKSRIFPSKMEIREFTYQKYLTSERRKVQYIFSKTQFIFLQICCSPETARNELKNF